MNIRPVRLNQETTVSVLFNAVWNPRFLAKAVITLKFCSSGRQLSYGTLETFEKAGIFSVPALFIGR